MSQSVSLHDTTGRLRSGKCYLRSFLHSSFSTSTPNSIAMYTAPQQDFLSSTQRQPVVSNVLTSVCSQPSATLIFSNEPSVSTRDQPLASPAICIIVGPADLPNISSTATSEVPHFRAKLCFYDVSPSFCLPSDVIRHPPPLTSSPSQPRHTRTRVVCRPDLYSS